jgi:hypothetical protein
MKKTILAVLLALICMVGVGNAFAAPPVWVPGVLSNTEDLIGVRFQSFASTSDPEIYVGIPDLLLPPNRMVADVTWAEINQITFTYSNIQDKLVAQVTNVNGTFSAEFTGIAYEILVHGKKFTLNDLNYIQITILNGDTNTTVNLNDAFLNGDSLGSFGGNCLHAWSVRTRTINNGFTITGILHLLGAFGTDPKLSMLEIKAGHETYNRPPDCSKARPSISMLWPPEHNFVNVNVLGVTDPDRDPLTIRIDKIFQDEPVKGNGDGNTSPDGTGINTSSAGVRAEREGSGNGRVYHIGFTANDGKGGTCSGEVRVGVPKSMGKKGGPVDNGALYDSTMP